MPVAVVQVRRVRQLHVPVQHGRPRPEGRLRPRPREGHRGMRLVRPLGVMLSPHFPHVPILAGGSCSRFTLCRLSSLFLSFGQTIARIEMSCLAPAHVLFSPKLHGFLRAKPDSALSAPPKIAGTTYGKFHLDCPVRFAPYIPVVKKSRMLGQNICYCGKTVDCIYPATPKSSNGT